VQADAAEALKEPGKQTVHAVMPAPRYLPWGHAIGVTAPGTGT
jgi:hypothetical protein